MPEITSRYVLGHVTVCPRSRHGMFLVTSRPFAPAGRREEALSTRLVSGLAAVVRCHPRWFPAALFCTRYEASLPVAPRSFGFLPPSNVRERDRSRRQFTVDCSSRRGALCPFLICSSHALSSLALSCCRGDAASLTHSHKNILCPGCIDEGGLRTRQDYLGMSNPKEVPVGS